MKTVILAGGFGTRISEETYLRPKPMIEIGGMPILWHIMKIYSAYGINDFVVCLGYKGYMIKEYFANYFLHRSDVTFDMASNNMLVHSNHVEPWKVTLVDTGHDVNTGGRLRNVRAFLDDGEDFCFTYGDGVSDVNIREVISLHREKGTIATLTAIQPPGRFGSLAFDGGDHVTSFLEKPMGDGGWVNGGFFVLSPGVFDYLEDNSTIFEKGPLEALAKEGHLSCYKHYGFWQSMDTLRDKNKLEELWSSSNPPWRVW